MVEFEFHRDAAFAVFDRQGSGCVSYGVEVGGRRLFVKTATNGLGRASLARSMAFHTAVRHDAIVAPIEAYETAAGPALVFPWRDGIVLNQATATATDRSGLLRFQRLAVPEVAAAVGVVLEAHGAVADAGFVAVDLYDGSFLYEFGTGTMRLIDLDDYRSGPFVVEADRLPGSGRYMAPEEWIRGSVIDEQTMVFGLGRAIQHLLGGPEGWRGTPTQGTVVERATSRERSERFASVDALLGAWHRALDADAPE
jgi:hypothetical protein